MVEGHEDGSPLRLEKTLCTGGVQLSAIEMGPAAKSNCRHGDFQLDGFVVTRAFTSLDLSWLKISILYFSNA